MNIRNDLPSAAPIAAETQVSGLERRSGVSSGAQAASNSQNQLPDQAHLSSAASLASQAASLPDVRAEKVQSIQSAIAAGTYNVPSSDVAHSLINHMLGRMLGNQD
jgi:flagellar biosynthesis anti-sigma factor FlgM